MRSRRTSNVVASALVVTALTALTALTVPATAQQGDAAAPPASAPETVTGLADRVTRTASAVTAAEQRQTTVAADLAAQDAKAAALQTRLGDLQQSSSALVAAAQRQALASYVQGDAAGQTFALASAIAQDDVNDVAWSLGVLKITHEHSLDLMRAATTAKGDANQELTAALAKRAALADEAGRTGPAVDQAKAELAAAQAGLAGLVHRLGATVADGMTTVAYDAYRRAASQLAAEAPACGLGWELLSAIGKTESNHGGGRLDAKGDSVVPIIGIPIGADTDAGALDLDSTRDHAVGPMQFIPSTWHKWGADGDGDGDSDPENIYDESLAAGRYLCAAAGGLTLLTRDGVIRAILSYNPNAEYLRVVGARFEALAADVASGWFSTGDLPVPSSAAAGDQVDGGGPPSNQPVTPPATELRTLTVFGDNGLTVQTSGDVVPATCGAPSAVLGPRSGFVRCSPAPATAPPAEPAPVLDPCVVSPFDPSLVACIADPQEPVRLVRATTPQVAAPASPAPPYLALTLSGGDVCRPVAAAGAPGAPQPPAPPDTTTSSPTDSTTSPPTDSSTTTSVAETTTTTATTAAPTSTAAPAVPVGPAVAYRCASGASVLGQPDTSAASWQTTISQAGAPNRNLAVTAAWR